MAASRTEAAVTTKARVCDSLYGRRDGGMTWSQRFIALAIVAAVVLAVVGAEPALPPALDRGIDVAEDLFGVFFLLEYAIRLWAVGAMPQFAGVRGRMRYVATPLAVIDLIVLLPYLLAAMGFDSEALRILRVLRILALLKMARYSPAVRLIVSSIVRRRVELAFATSFAGMLVLVTSAALYVVEGALQPEAFGSITRSMYWSVITLTSTGYGDVVPVTPLGKVCAGLTALSGIAMIAMVTGILAAAFSDGLARARQIGLEARDEETAA
jgi:voltage-gated potassium channel